MAHLKLYGQPTSTVEYFKMMVRKNAERANINLNIEEVTDVSTFIKENINTIPTVKLNEHIQMSFDGIDINAFIQEVNFALLNDENFGSMKKIIVPVDFSKCSENALIFALNLAKAINGTIEICHYYRPHGSDIYEIEMNDTKSIYEKQFNTLVETVKNLEGKDIDSPVSIKSQFTVGFPVQEIIKKAEEDDAIIIMGTTGESGSKNFFGSISTDVAQKTHKPILLIPKNMEFASFKKIVVALDDRQIDNKNLQFIHKLKSISQGRVDFVHVTERIQEVYLSVDSDKIPRYDGFDNCRYKEIISQNVNEGIQLYCEEEAADLLVIFNNHRNIISKIFNPSKTKQMTLSSHVPLLILSNNNK